MGKPRGSALNEDETSSLASDGYLRHFVRSSITRKLAQRGAIVMSWSNLRIGRFLLCIVLFVPAIAGAQQNSSETTRRVITVWFPPIRNWLVP